MVQPKTLINQQNKTISKIAGVILLIFASIIVLKIPCPSNAQNLIVYAFIGVSFALIFPKDAEKSRAKFTTKDISVILTGSIAIPFVLFYVNPIDRWVKADNCSVHTNVTVTITDKQGVESKILTQGFIVMDVLSKETKREPINVNGESFFQNLSVGDSIRLSIDFSEPYKPIRPDSIYIIRANEKIHLPIKLEGIDQVKGKVLYNNESLQGVTVELEGKSDELDTITNIKGEYHFIIPEPMQDKSYHVIFRKDGFKTDTAIAYPQTGQLLKIVMEKK